MMFIHHGPGKSIVKTAVWLSWPIIVAAKRLSNVPVFKWLIRPFFMRPYNEVTSVPINVTLPGPETVALPRRIIERLLADVEEKFIIGECICRSHNKVDNPPQDIGCMALGPAARRIHPSHGRMVSTEEAIRHVRRAAQAGLIANIAHVWIDPMAFGTRFRDLLFICFCDDTNCIYRTYMKDRGPTLDRAYRRLPGIVLSVDKEKCKGCGQCADNCFLAAISVDGGNATVGASCAGCGRCAEICPNGAITLAIEGEEALYSQLIERIREVSELPLRGF
jgi:ferredoxin